MADGTGTDEAVPTGTTVSDQSPRGNGNGDTPHAVPPPAMGAGGIPPPDPPPAPDRKRAFRYDGLSSVERKKLIKISVWIALFNMVLAWGCIAFVLWHIATMQSLTQSSFTSDPTVADSEPNSVILKAYGSSLWLHMFNIANKACLIALSIGTGFAMMALGYGLFTLGADGAFQLQAASDEKSNIVLQGAAPGLFCFLLATVIICFGLTRPQALELGPFTPNIGIGRTAQTDRTEELKQQAEARRAKADPNALKFFNTGKQQGAKTPAPAEQDDGNPPK